MCKPVAPTHGGTHSDNKGLCQSGGADAVARTAVPSGSFDFKRCMPVLLFDWDDTLFPTTSLRKLGPERLRTELGMIDSCVAHLIRMAAAVPGSRVIILTNANISWVYYASREFLPTVYGLLQKPPENFQVLSAHRPRESCPPEGTPEYEQEVAKWKRYALQAQAPALQENLHACGLTEVQVVSIGDMPHDLEAGAYLAKEFLKSSRQLVKMVRMKPAPTVEDVLGELRLLCSHLGPMLAYPRSFHQVMVPALWGAGAARAGAGALRREAPTGTEAVQTQEPDGVQTTGGEGDGQDCVQEDETC